MVTTTVSPQGGALFGGTATVAFTHGTGQVAPDLVVEWDFDNDGDFSEDVEDVTSYVLSGESMSGRDFPSQLTGKAGPGQLKLTLLNNAGRFSHFNQASPLNQGGNSLASGRKIRVRTSTAVDPDPVLLARDRFLGSGALATDELGNAWVNRTGPRFDRQADSSGATMAVPDTKGATATDAIHIATVDVGVDDLYAQIRWRHLDMDNLAGIAYRFEDASNYGLIRVAQTTDYGQITIGEYNAGVFSSSVSFAVEIRDDDYLGVLVAGDFVTVFHNGVDLPSAAAFSSSATSVGLWCNWHIQRPPSVRELYVWDGLPAATEGVLWTGDVVSVVPTINPGGPPIAEVTAEGWLARAAAHEIDPPNSLGFIPTGTAGNNSPGTPSGVAVGAALGRAGLLHPPGDLDAGSTLGAVGLVKANALEIVRQFEEAELGFLHESNEGHIAFNDRAAAASATVAAGFSDQPGAQFGYSAIELQDWRNEIVNRVEAKIAPRAPIVRVTFGHQATNTDVTAPLVSLAGLEVGDLVIVVAASAMGLSGQNWEQPVGWTEFRRADDHLGKLRIYAKRLDTDDLTDDVIFYDRTSETASWVMSIVAVRDWYGDVQNGVVVTDPHGFGQPSSVARARAGDNDPPPVFPPWAPAPSLVITYRGGMTGSGVVADETVDEAFAPNGFFFLITDALGTAARQTAMRFTNDGVVDPSSFVTDGDEARFNNYDFVETVTIAVRGFAGDPPEVEGGQLVVVDDFASQEAHNSVRTHTNPARLFADEDDARAYCEAVLLRHANPRPIVTLSFVATTNASYRAQAIRRRVGDKIHLTANGDTVMGIEGDFIIENVAHQWPNPKLWVTTWQLSPA